MSTVDDDGVHAGKLTAAVKGPTRNIPVHVDDLKNGRPTLRFTPEEEGEQGILDILLECEF